MNRAYEKSLMERAVALGNSQSADALNELCELIQSPSAQVRRLSASAIGKLAGLANPQLAVNTLVPRLKDPHPQVRQYAIKALKAYGTHAVAYLNDLRDICTNPAEKPYNQRDAQLAVEVIVEALRIEEQQATHTCQHCGVSVEPDEYARSMRAFNRVYCDHCFDEIYLKRRNWDTKVELQKTITTRDGTLVQSDGERQIAEFLAHYQINYRYDERIRILDGYAIRPDFYLPEFDLYIEYWGMDTLDYQISMLKKLKLYQHQGKRLVSISFKEKSNLASLLYQKLSKYMQLP